MAGPANTGVFMRAIEAETDNGPPLLMTLPKFTFNRAFVGRNRRAVQALLARAAGNA